PEILKEVLAGIDVTWDLRGRYHPREFCVQYRESDFAFASRLMEEEGIYYYFMHDKKGHSMVVADAPQGHRETPRVKKAIFDANLGGNRNEPRVRTWEKAQELRSGKVTLRDNCFELPSHDLEARQVTQPDVPVGKVVHRLRVGDNEQLELYD